MQRSARSSETQGTAQSSEISRYRIPCRGMRTRYHLINPIEVGKTEMFHGGPDTGQNEGMPSAQQTSNRDTRTATGNTYIGSAEGTPSSTRALHEQRQVRPLESPTEVKRVEQDGEQVKHCDTLAPKQENPSGTPARTNAAESLARANATRPLGTPAYGARPTGTPTSTDSAMPTSSDQLGSQRSITEQARPIYKLNSKILPFVEWSKFKPPNDYYHPENDPRFNGKQYADTVRSEHPLGMDAGRHDARRARLDQ